MSLVAPSRLWLLLAVAAVAVAYVVVQLRGRRRYALRFSNVALLGSVAPRRPGWRRHLPPALLLLSLAAMVLTLARPSRAEQVPVERATVVLAVDVSISMDATDVRPNRLGAAREAARSFAGQLPERFNLGLVSFAGTATVRVAPTTDRRAVTDAIDRLELAEATAIGDAVLASLDAIASMVRREDGEAGRAEDERVPASIVLMSDGETTAGTPNRVAAQRARDDGVPVTTIGFGTDDGTITYEGDVVPVPVNEQELAQLAETTGGSAFAAATGEELQSAYDDIGSLIGYETEQREIGRWFVGAALVLSLLGAVTSLRWFARLP
jgi:Ca-activated chloride channel family protein